MSQVEKVSLTIEHFNSGRTVVVMTHKQTELYNVKLHSENTLLNALNNAIAVRLI